MNDCPESLGTGVPTIRLLLQGVEARRRPDRPGQPHDSPINSDRRVALLFDRRTDCAKREVALAVVVGDVVHGGANATYGEQVLRCEAGADVLSCE